MIKSQHHTKIFIAFAGVSCALLSGCNLEPNYTPAEVTTPHEWKAKQAPVETPVAAATNEAWWEVFGDPYLNELETKATENNPSLQASAQRIEQSRNLALIAYSQFYPQLNVTPMYSNTDSLIQTYGVGGTILRAQQLNYELPLNLSYELDIWDKIANTVKAANLATEAQEQAYQTLRLMLTSDLAKAYFSLRIQDQLIELYEASVQNQMTALLIHQSRFDTQIENYSPVANAKIQLSKAQTECFNAKKQRALFENQIALLIGTSPSEFSVPAIPFVIDLPPMIPEGTPSTILLQRPDLAEKERLMRSLHAQIGVAYAAYFPSITLIGAGGLLSPSAGDFFSWLARYGMIGANMSQLVFDGGAASANIQFSWASYREMVNVYQYQALAAFKEVEDALSNLHWIKQEIAVTKSSILDAEQAYTINLDRFQQGVDLYLSVTKDQEQVLERKRAYTALLGVSYTDTIHLIKAIGGGWN